MVSYKNPHLLKFGFIFVLLVIFVIWHDITFANEADEIQESYNANEIEIEEFGPSEIKSTVCGNGRADKKAVQKMVKLLMNLEKIPKPDDVADAIAIALCGASTEGHLLAQSHTKK